MLEDVSIRNFAENAQRTYLRQVSAYAQSFQHSPRWLEPAEVRAYQVHLVEVRKLNPASAGTAASALRFLGKVTLEREGMVEDIPSPKKPF